jgi:hypothetical protein
LKIILTSFTIICAAVDFLPFVTTGQICDCLKIYNRLVFEQSWPNNFEKSQLKKPWPVSSGQPFFYQFIFSGYYTEPQLQAKKIRLDWEKKLI